LAYRQGTQLRSEIEARGASRLVEAAAAATAALARRFGASPVDGKIEVLVVAIER
jgi:hypothetical protein